MVTPSNPPPPTNNFYLYPPPVFRCFLKDPLMINSLSDNVMFVRDFNSKLESFGCANKNTSGPMLKNIQKQLNLIYLNNDEFTHMDRANGSTDLLDMAFVSANLEKHDMRFQIGDDLGNDHLPSEISTDAPNEYELVEDVDPQFLIKLVKFLKRVKAPGPRHHTQ